MSECFLGNLMLTWWNAGRILSENNRPISDDIPTSGQKPKAISAAAAATEKPRALRVSRKRTERCDQTVRPSRRAAVAGEGEATTGGRRRKKDGDAAADQQLAANKSLSAAAKKCVPVPRCQLICFFAGGTGCMSQAVTDGGAANRREGEMKAPKTGGLSLLGLTWWRKSSEKKSEAIRAVDLV